MNTAKDGLAFMQLDVYRVTRELVVRVGALRISDRELHQQATRAAASVLLQLSEGLPLNGQASRRKYFNTARGSVCEVAAAVDVAAALGFASSDQVAEVLVLAGRVKQMLERLNR
jgi:four helix bundle protein